MLLSHQYSLNPTYLLQRLIKLQGFDFKRVYKLLIAVSQEQQASDIYNK